MASVYFCASVSFDVKSSASSPNPVTGVYLNPTFEDDEESCSISATFQIVNSTPANGLSFDVFASVPSYLLIVNVPF